MLGKAGVHDSGYSEMGRNHRKAQKLMWAILHQVWDVTVTSSYASEARGWQNQSYAPLLFHHVFILASGPREADSDSEELINAFMGKMESNQQFLPPCTLGMGIQLLFGLDSLSLRGWFRVLLRPSVWMFVWGI